MSEPAKGVGASAPGGAEQSSPAVDFDELFDRYYPVVRRFFARRTAPEDAAELTQETFLRIYTGLKGFRGEAALGTWVFRIAHNTWARWARRHASHPEPSYGRSPGGPSETEEAEVSLRAGDQRSATASEPESPLETYLDEERRDALERAVAELPDQMRKCMTLRLYQELSYREIATVLRISVDTVKAHLFQGRRKLSERLGADPEQAAGRRG